VVDGKIVERWGIGDIAGIMIQLKGQSIWVAIELIVRSGTPGRIA
jgi:hypothetical protein